MLRIALVFANLPSVEEIDQFQAVDSQCELSVMTSESIAVYLRENSYYNQLSIISLPDYDDSTTYLPGLESALENFDIVVIKDRVGICAYQALKAKWRYRLRLLVLVDNGTPFVGQDLPRLRSIRSEVSNAADGFIVQSKACFNTLLLEGVEAARIHSLSPWVDREVDRSPDGMRAGREQLGFSESNLVIGYVGEIEWEEGLVDLLNSIKWLSTHRESVARRIKLVVYGIGSFAGELRKHSIEMGIDQHVSYVMPNRVAYATILQSADCLYIGSTRSRDRIDANPFRYLVGMACGIPIVCGRSEIVEETIGKHRVDYCPGSVKSLAEALEKVLEARGLMNNIRAKNHRTFSERFTESRFCEEFSAIIGSIDDHVEEDAGSNIDKVIREIEDKVAGKQYLVGIEHIERLLSKSDLPTHHRSNLFRLVGDCFTKLGDTDAGKSAYIQAIEIDSFSWKSHIGLGTISLIKQNFEIGVIHFQKAVALAPDDEMANLGLGLSFQGLDEFVESAKWICKSLDVNPDNTAAIYSLMRVCSESADLKTVEGRLRIYLGRHPDDNEMKFSFAGVLYELGQLSEVLVVLQEITASDPLNSRAQALLRKVKREQEKARGQSVNM